MKSLIITVLLATLLSHLSAQTCPSIDNWETIGHDAQRTSASGGCISSLTYLWSYKPVIPIHNSFSNTGTGNMVATSSNVYYRYARYDSFFYSGTRDKGCIDNLSMAGNKIWSNQSLGANHDTHHWIALMGGNIYFNDDYIQKISLSTGASLSALGIDYWGEILPSPDGTKIYTSNEFHLDGAGVWVGALATNLSEIWKKNNVNTSFSLKDINRGALALDNNVLYFAPKYRRPQNSTFNYADGVYAFNASNGALLWSVATNPTARISAKDGLVYVLENNDIVARSQNNGSIVWSNTLTGTIVVGQPPVLANGMTIVATSTGVFAYDALSGDQKWNTLMNGINPINGYDTEQATVIAAALGSNTLIVTTEVGIHILSLINGQELSQPVVIPSKRPVNPVIVGNRLYVSTLYPINGLFPSTMYAYEDKSFINTVDVIPPSVSILNTDNKLSGTEAINVLATDNVGVERVELYIGNTLVGSKYSPPYTFNINTTLYANGNYTLTAKGYDAMGNTGVSTLFVSIYNTPDITPPVIIIHSPLDGYITPARGNKNLDISASATDNMGVISNMKIFFDNVLYTSCNTSYCTTTIKGNKLSQGLHSIKVTATDNSNNTTTKTIGVIIR